MRFLGCGMLPKILLLLVEVINNVALLIGRLF